MNIKPQEITIDPNNPYDGNLLFRNEQAAKALHEEGQAILEQAKKEVEQMILGQA